MMKFKGIKDVSVTKVCILEQIYKHMLRTAPQYKTLKECVDNTAIHDFVVLTEQGVESELLLRFSDNVVHHCISWKDTNPVDEPHWQCTRCGEDYRNHAQYLPYPELSDNEINQPPCIECNEAKLVWFVPENKYSYQVWWDGAYQCYRQANGDVVDVGQSECSDWDFPCPRCYGPAKLTSIDAYGENHKCLNCTNTFRVS